MFWGFSLADQLFPPTVCQVEMICSWLGIQYYKENARSKIYVDFLFHALHFVKEAEFSLEKMVTLFSVLQYIFEAATGFSGATSNSSQVNCGWVGG